MRRREIQRPEVRAVRRDNDVVVDDLQWNFGREPLPDYGVDALAEVVADDDLVAGRLIGLQTSSARRPDRARVLCSVTASQARSPTSRRIGSACP